MQLNEGFKLCLFFYFCKVLTRCFFLLVLMVAGYFGKGQDVDSLRAAVNTLKADSLKIKAWLSLSSKYSNKNFKLEYEFADSSLNLSKKLKLKDFSYKAYEKLAFASQNLGNFDASFNFFKKCYEYHAKLKNNGAAARMLNRMGENKRLLDDYKSALSYFQKSLRLLRQVGDSNEMGSVYINIGVMYAVKGDRPEGEEYFLKAIEIYRNTKNTERQYLTILNLGGLYREMGKYEKSLEYSTMARDYFKSSGNDKRKAIADYNIGVAYFAMNDLEKSKNAYLSCLVEFEKLGDKMRIYGTQMRLSEIYLKQGENNRALTYALQALKGSEELESKSMQTFLYNHIYQIYEARNDFKNALKYKILYHEMKDSISATELSAQIAELEKKFQAENQELKIEKLSSVSKINERDKLLAEKKVKEQKLITWFLIGLSVLILFISLLILRQYRLKKKNNAILESKNLIIQKSLKEKELLLNEIHHRVKNNLQFISSMLNLQSRHVQDDHASEVLMDIKNRVHTLALVHQRLYQEDDLKGVEMRSFLNSLIDGLVYSLKVDREKIGVQRNIDAITLDVDVAVSIGLIVNEGITNAFKYGFSQLQTGLLEVSLIRGDEKLVLTLKDSGKGFPDSILKGERNGFGLQLIGSLSEKLNSKLVYYNEDGAGIKVSIPLQTDEL